MLAMLGWFSEARTRASRWNRPKRSGSSAKTSGRTFKATSWPSFMSLARYTSPMPPWAMRAVTSYGPRRVPGVRDMAMPG